MWISNQLTGHFLLIIVEFHFSPNRKARTIHNQRLADLFEKRATIDDCRFKDPGIIACREPIPNNIGHEGRDNPESGKYIASGQDYFPGIDAHRAEHRTPPACIALLKIFNPSIDSTTLKIGSTCKSSENPAGPSKVSAKYLADTTGTRGRNIREIIHSQVTLAGFGTGPASGAVLQHYPKGMGVCAVFAQQFQSSGSKIRVGNLVVANGPQILLFCQMKRNLHRERSSLSTTFFTEKGISG
jgi:hypothetical protein